MRASVAGGAIDISMPGGVSVEDIVCLNTVNSGMAVHAFGLGDPGNPSIIDGRSDSGQVPVTGCAIAITGCAHMGIAPAAFCCCTRMAIIA